MPILELQRRQTEVGRIRIGESVDTGRKDKNGNPIRRPKKLETFRFTSSSKQLIEQIAAIYGGAPAEWSPQGGGAKQWEVYTESRSISVVVPPGSVSQWYELWTGGMCSRRCDGQRELISDKPCMCPPDPAERKCKPTTRLSLMLADVPGIGVWRCETHGFYAATELPAVAELLAAAGGYVAARLELEQRTAKRPKAGGGVETRHWMVPVLHVDAAPAQLLALTGGNGRAAIPAADERQAIEAAPTGNGNGRQTAAQLTALVRLAQHPNQLKSLWASARELNQNDPGLPALRAEFDRKAAEFKAVGESETPTETPVAESVDGEVEPDADAVWSQIQSAVPVEWGTDGLETRVIEFLGKSSIDANGFDLQRFLTAVKAGEVQ